MGADSEAIIAYGYALGSSEAGWAIKGVDVLDDFDPEWLSEDLDFREGVEARLLAAVGFEETWATATAAGTTDGYWKRRTEAEQEVGVKLIGCCSYDYPFWVLATRQEDVEWGAKPLDPAWLVATPDEGERLKWALGVLGIEPTQDAPTFVLASMYG
jgi:hypothetical protein